MKGHCLCKAVTVTAPDKADMSACHCSTCRRWGGGPQGPAFTFQEQIFVDEKPADYDFANDTPKLTGAEVFAKFTPPG